MSKSPRRLALVVAVALAVAACSGTHRIAGVDTLSGPASTTVPPATTAPGPATTVPPCDPTASIRPEGPPTIPANSFIDRIHKRGRLIAGVDQNTYLFGYLNPADGKLEGFDIDMVHQIAKAIFGDENAVDFKAITSIQRIPFITSNQVDIVVRTMTVTCQRWQQVDFSSVYYLAGQKVLVQRGSPITGSQDLGGKRVCGTTGSTSIDNVQNTSITHARSPAIPFPVADWSDCLVALQQGKVDAVSTDDPILAGLAAQDPNTEIVGSSFSDQPYGMAINKAYPEFVQFVNAVLDRMRSDGTWARIYANHLPPPVPAPPPAHYSS
ncbi:MAG TPA: transporter substrate-binding domain-containing protein [Acidimicrobiales bacterium]